MAFGTCAAGRGGVGFQWGLAGGVSLSEEVVGAGFVNCSLTIMTAGGI